MLRCDGLGWRMRCRPHGLRLCRAHRCRGSRATATAPPATPLFAAQETRGEPGRRGEQFSVGERRVIRPILHPHQCQESLESEPVNEAAPGHSKRNGRAGLVAPTHRLGIQDTSVVFGCGLHLSFRCRPGCCHHRRCATGQHFPLLGPITVPSCKRRGGPQPLDPIFDSRRCQ
jgi:hypothetical protein